MSTPQAPPEFGMNLMRLRESRGFTIEECCFTLNLGKRYWEQWERGQGFPSINVLLKICNFLRYFNIYQMCTQEIKFRGQPVEAAPITDKALLQ